MADTCETCEACEAFKVTVLDPNIGECKKKSPVIPGSDTRFDPAVWPLVIKATPACLEYKKA